MLEVSSAFSGYDEIKEMVFKIIKYQQNFIKLLNFGEKYHDKFLSTYGVGLSHSLLEKQTKMLFHLQMKDQIFREMMTNLTQADSNLSN